MMNLTPKSILLWVAAVAIVALSYMKMGWAGVALTVGMLVFWLLLNMTRMLRTLKSAANNPKGMVGSAVMLNARLKPGMSLLQIVALTHSLGEEVSQEPEIWRWRDEGASFVECTLQKGKLAEWQLTRPESEN